MAPAPKVNPFKISLREVIMPRSFPYCMQNVNAYGVTLLVFGGQA